MASALALSILTGGSLALASSAHCAVMCGPLALASRVRHGGHAGTSYFAGRLLTYSLLGSLAGGAGRVLLLTSWARLAEAILSWLLAATLLWTAWSLLRGTRRQRLSQLGKGPNESRIGALLVHVADDPFLLGAATALLPCAALFSALVASAALGSPSLGALSMATFAVITGAVVTGVGQLARLRVRFAGLRQLVGVVLLLGAAVTAYRPVAMLRAKSGVPDCHGASHSAGGTDGDRR